VYLLDTNTLIYFFKGMGQVADHLLAIPPRDIAIPAISLFELETGLRKSTAPAKRRRQLSALTDLVTVIPFGMREAETAAEIRAVLEQQGQPIGPYDVLIAGTALAHNATLVTRNHAEFSRIDGLQLVDWFERREAEPVVSDR
jgi:tRNA(fMet)-specific endonuclease VapC